MQAATQTLAPDVLVVDLPEKLVMANSQAQADAVTSQIDQGHRRVVFNLAPVKFIDSSGLAVLVAALKKLRPLNGKVALASPGANVLSLIELTRLHEIFEIFSDLETAVTELTNDKN